MTKRFDFFRLFSIVLFEEIFGPSLSITQASTFTSFQTVKPTKNLGRVRTTRMIAVMAREQSKEADHSSAPCKPALGHCQIEARHKRMKKEGRKYSNLLALKVLLDSL